MSNINFSQNPFSQNLQNTQQANNNYSLPQNNYAINGAPMQSFFPQSQGSVFMINSSSEINNIPISNGMTAAFCLAEGIVYLKTFQNNTPFTFCYKLSSPDNPAPAISTEVKSDDQIGKIIERLEKIEKQLNSKTGGKTVEWQV